MKNLTRTALLLAVLLGLEVIWPSWLKPAGLGPDLILIFVVLCSAYFSPPAAVSWGLAAGLAQVGLGGDWPAAGWQISGQIISYGLISFIISNFLQQPWFAGLYYRAALVLAAALAVGTGKALAVSADGGWSNLILILVVAVYSSVITPLINPGWPRSET